MRILVLAGRMLLDDDLASTGITANERWVWKLCSQQHIWSVFAKNRGLRVKAGPLVPDDFVKRKFNATRANELWLTNITKHQSGEGKLYLCAIKDVYSNRIVGCSIDSRMQASFVVAALRDAIILRSPIGTMLHSDRGSEFCSKAFVRMLKNNNLIRSIGRVGTCGDSAPMDSFFALLQKNVPDR